MAASESYWIATRSGRIAAFGDAPPLGSLADQGSRATVIAAAATPDGTGCWLLGDDGGVFSFGSARFHGAAAGRLATGTRAVDLAAGPEGRGYWVVDDRGGVHAFGEAPVLGDLPPVPDHVRVARIVGHPDGEGYWLVDHVGGVFSFGDCTFHGALPGAGMAETPADLVPAPDGDGYLIVTRSGRFRAYGSWRDREGTLPYDLTRTRGLVAACGSRSATFAALAVDVDGVVFPLGDASFEGSTVGEADDDPVVAIERAAVPEDDEPGFRHPLERRAWSRPA